MAFEQLFIRTKKSIGGISLDAVLEESHENRVTLTRNPVEFGVDITDHAIVQPVKLSIVAVVSDTPLGTAALGEVVNSVTGLFGRSTIDASTRSQAAYLAMVALQKRRQPVQVQTKLSLYDNMVITGVDVVQDKNTSREAMLVIALEEVRIVNTQIITLSEEQLGSSAFTQAYPPANNGRQQPVQPSPQTNASIAKAIFRFFGFGEN